jgi:tetratricopeptide (TPR) repeat protein
MAEEWVVIQLDEKVARMHGLPARVPAPKSEYEGLAESGFELPKLKKWITAFLSAAPPAWRAQNADLAKSYDRFVAKADFWQRGVAALQKKDVAGAIAAFKMVSSVDPDDHAARMNLGLAYAQSGDAAQAKKALLAVRATYEGDVDYHLALGQSLLTLSERDAATDEFALALEAQPDSSAALQALASLGVLVAVYENPRDATSLVYLRKDALAETLEAIWAEAPRDREYFLLQAEYHAAEGRHDIALAAAERAVGLEGAEASERAEIARAAALRMLGRLDEARARLDAFLATRADAVRALVERARLHSAAGRKADADRDVAAVLARDGGDLEALALRYPLERTLSEESAARLAELRAWADEHASDAGAWLWLGLMQSKAGAIDDALDTLKKAVALAPGDDDVRATYWIELGRAGRWDAVIADSLTLDMKTRSWKVRWNEAEAYAALGKKAEARAVYGEINADERLPIDLRKRAKRAAER